MKVVTDKPIYELTLSQRVSILQLMFSLDKRIINIPASLTFDDDVSYDTLNQAWDLLIKRNDTLRLLQWKEGKKYYQIFRDYEDSKYTLKHISIKSQEAFDKWFLKKRKVPVKYLDGEIYEATVIDREWDHKKMIYIVFAHTIIDIYGIGMLVKDLGAIMDHLTKGTELPEPLSNYEEVVKKDNSIQQNEEHFQKEVDFFYEWLRGHEVPEFEGMKGSSEPIMKKRRKKGIRNAPMFFIRNNTEGYRFPFDEETSILVNKYCEEHKYTPSNVYYFLVHAALAKVNDDRGLMMPCLLNNMRGTFAERNTAGCKVQSVQSYVTVDKEKTLTENMEQVMKEYYISMKHIGFDDTKFQFMWREVYKAPFLGTFFTMTYSFVPMYYPKGIQVEMYDNGKFSLPIYFDIMMDAETGLIHDVIYCAQTMLSDEKDVTRFHRIFQDLSKELVTNPDKKLKDITVNLEY